MANAALTDVYTWVMESPVRLRKHLMLLDCARAEIRRLREEIRIKDARLSKIAPAGRRPRYSAFDRMAILNLKAGGRWSNAETARRFLVEPETVASWIKRLNSGDGDTLVRINVPVNKFPDAVRYAVRQLRIACPLLGKEKAAKFLVRAGLKIGGTTVWRITKEAWGRRPVPAGGVKKRPPAPAAEAEAKSVISRWPNHVWQVDLTVLPVFGGFWRPWFPFSQPQVWPFAWHGAFVIDHYSRKMLGFELYRRQPSARDVLGLLDGVRNAFKATPAHLISDKGTQFWPGREYLPWCSQRRIAPRFGAVGKSGSIAVIERFFRGLKYDFVRRLLHVFDTEAMRAQIRSYCAWYNAVRPHDTLRGRTPDEVYSGVASCIEPAAISRNDYENMEINIDWFDDNALLPVISIKNPA